MWCKVQCITGRHESLCCWNMSHVLLSTHFQTTSLRLFQAERVCRRQFQFDDKGKRFSKYVENTVGKRENCSLRAISPFPTVFSKDFHCRHRACLRKGLINNNRGRRMSAH